MVTSIEFSQPFGHGRILHAVADQAAHGAVVVRVKPLDLGDGRILVPFFD
ncbi:MAG: hypothetical protein J0M04_24920 [Verrucomicrobia bacterium]|nr:hypothetical protein [Verrucomicrobiota bacterium]